mmetsp:Transcript_60396/g.168763  ORF Transcript_60396/g.168763 Transcript_60396/m.168763 type:complete len:218 (+) Transcript_60396:459-1112(+)
MSHMEMWPSSCEVASCGESGLRLKLVTARATVQLQTQLAAAASQTRTEQSQEPLRSVNGKRARAPKRRLETTWLWPARVNFGATPSPASAAPAFRFAPALSLASGSAKRAGSAFQSSTSLFQPALAKSVPSSLMATASVARAGSSPVGARRVAAGPNLMSSPELCCTWKHFVHPSFPAARRRLPEPEGKAVMAVRGRSDSRAVRRGRDSSYNRTVPS